MHECKVHDENSALEFNLATYNCVETFAITNLRLTLKHKDKHFPCVIYVS